VPQELSVIQVVALSNTLRSGRLFIGTPMAELEQITSSVKDL
jgi:hypothetical protein